MNIWTRAFGMISLSDMNDMLDDYKNMTNLKKEENIMHLFPAATQASIDQAEVEMLKQQLAQQKTLLDEAAKVVASMECNPDIDSEDCPKCKFLEKVKAK